VRIAQYEAPLSKSKFDLGIAQHIVPVLALRGSRSEAEWKQSPAERKEIGHLEIGLLARDTC